MNVKDLKAAIFYFPDDMKVLLAIDEEGNNFHEAADVQQSCYVTDDGYSYDLLDDDEADEDEPLGLIIWP